MGNIGQFIDNPTISALGDQLGLGAVFDAARSGIQPELAATQNTTPAPKPAQSAPNVPEYRNRPYIPRMETPVAGRGVGPGVNPSSAITPGVMDPATLQDPNVRTLLSQYGVTPPSTPPDPNLFIHNPQAFQNHPLASGLIERGLEGLAFAHPGGNFLDSLIGGVRGMGEANSARAAQENAQVMAPLQQAQAIQTLQEKYDQHLTSQDNIAYHAGMLKHYKDEASDKLEAMYMGRPPSMDAATGEMGRMMPDEKSPTGYSWQVDPTLGRDEDKYQKYQYYTKAIQDLADKNHNGDVDAVTPAEHLQVMSDYEKAKSMATGASAQAVAKTKANAPKKGTAPKPGSLTDVQRAQLADLTKQEADIDAEDKSTASLINGGVTLQGTMITGPQQKGQYRQQLQQKRQDLENKKNAIMGLVAPAPQAAPAYSNGNPFVHSKP